METPHRPSYATKQEQLKAHNPSPELMIAVLVDGGPSPRAAGHCSPPPRTKILPCGDQCRTAFSEAKGDGLQIQPAQVAGAVVPGCSRQKTSTTGKQRHAAVLMEIPKGGVGIRYARAAGRGGFMNEGLRLNVAVIGLAPLRRTRSPGMGLVFFSWHPA